MSAFLTRFLENVAKANGPNGPNGTGVERDRGAAYRVHDNKDVQSEVELFHCLSPSTPSPLGPLGPISETADGNGKTEPSIEPRWTDDRAWVADIVRAPDEASKLAVLGAWVTMAGGETVGRTVLLPALLPHRERRLAEVELRRMVRSCELETLEDEAA